MNPEDRQQLLVEALQELHDAVNAFKKRNAIDYLTPENIGVGNDRLEVAMVRAAEVLKK